jgi:hypothetical protein
MPALVGFGKLVGKFYDVVVEMAQRFVFGVASSPQMHTVGDIAR